jgi:protein N-terminal methyltransferase
MASHVQVAGMVQRFLETGASTGYVTGDDVEITVLELWTRLLTDSSVGLARKEGGADEHSSTSAESWYALGAAYWNSSSIPASIDCVLGGLEDVHPDDIRTSGSFLLKIREQFGMGGGAVVDCGAGIGRVTRHLLCNHFDECDLVEPSSRLLSAAREYCAAKMLGTRGTARHFFQSGLQDFTFSSPAPPSADGRPAIQYDAVWLQWVVGTVLDLDLIRFFQVRGAQTLLADHASHSQN